MPRPWMLVLALGLGACDRDETTPSTFVTEDDQGQLVRVTTIPAPTLAAPQLAASRAACDLGVLDRCADLADALLNEGRSADAEEVWYRACLAGHGRSCADLGYQYNNPYMTLQHPERALDVLTRGCESAEHPPIACASLASRYAADARTRFGTPPDPDRHRELIERACRDGHHWSCEAAGLPTPAP